MKSILILLFMAFISILCGIIVSVMENGEIDNYYVSGSLIPLPLGLILTIIEYGQLRITFLSILFVLIPAILVLCHLSDNETPAVTPKPVHVESPEERRQREIDEMIEEITKEQHDLGNIGYSWDKKCRGTCEVWQKIDRNTIAVYEGGKFRKYIFRK